MHIATDGQFKRHFYCSQLTLWLRMEARVREPLLLTEPLTAWCLNQNCLVARSKASQAVEIGVRNKASGPLFNSEVACCLPSHWPYSRALLPQLFQETVQFLPDHGSLGSWLMGTYQEAGADL